MSTVRIAIHAWPEGHWPAELRPAARHFHLLRLRKLGKQVLIAAHGNSLRALIKYLDNVSDEDILSMNVPTGMPLVYELDENLKPLSRQYLGDPEKVAKAMEAVANQGKAK